MQSSRGSTAQAVPAPWTGIVHSEAHPRSKHLQPRPTFLHSAFCLPAPQTLSLPSPPCSCAVFLWNHPVPDPDLRSPSVKHTQLQPGISAAEPTELLAPGNAPHLWICAFLSGILNAAEGAV
ncbi:hypothetical protein DV515_00015204 [Chloebia gouldiae]|uniref:Uncharacterized protein n=1 Tax=Chloebia gouldiae TaxID=44316 RepID=A0A3L8RVU0_CHLGU|nr:hypothetical protein DV515_00015204 [Chloebia gouldiae]